MRRKAGYHAFTLIELLIIVAIIGVLLAILAPSVHLAVQLGLSAKCTTQLRQVGLAMTHHASSNKRRFPGLWGPPWTGPAEGQGPWMGKEAYTRCPSPAGVTRYGLLSQYLGGVDTVVELYRCPGLDEGVLRSGVGSNGMFDYTMVQSFPGARLSAVPPTAEVIDPKSDQLLSVPTPLVVEEDPAFHINERFVDMGHTSINRLGTWHPGGQGNYIAVDGSARGIRSGDNLGPQCYQWYAEAPSGTVVSLGQACNYGGWNAR